MESLCVFQITQHFILMRFHLIYTVGAWCKMHKYVQCVTKFQKIEPSLFICNTSQTIVNVGWVEQKHIYNKKQNEMNKTQHNKTVGGQYNNFFCCIELPNGSHLVKQRNKVQRKWYKAAKLGRWKNKIKKWNGNARR